jgi:hypothetical protein
MAGEELMASEGTSTLGECTRVAGRAAALLKLGDEKEIVENSAAISIARKYNLVS